MVHGGSLPGPSKWNVPDGFQGSPALETPPDGGPFSKGKPRTT